MDDLWVKLEEREVTDPSAFDFWKGINVWIERPHLVNRKLMGKEDVFRFYNPDNSDERYKHLLEDVFASEDLSQYLTMRKDSNDQLNEQIDKLSVTFRRLIPKDIERFPEVKEAVITETQDNVVTFWPEEDMIVGRTVTPLFPYRIRLDNTKICMEIYEKTLIKTASIQASKEWLATSVFPKVYRWCCSSSTSGFKSLNLVSERSYCHTYYSLKQKYKRFVENWREASDPKKSVYEAVGIAAYLMVYWEKERNLLKTDTKQKFIDLGCGNGLLVHILTCEGYTGIGVDVRKRKIWDLYGKNTTLIEKTIDPFDYSIFKEYDWIIGNHSDELTPWIPVIAARCNYQMKAFIVPCCFYSFCGKYERMCPDKTQYQSYLNFIKSVCVNMGFQIELDKLRIPSTKRVCLVCNTRPYNEEDELMIDIKRMEFIKSHSGNVPNNSAALKETNSIVNFKPREKVQLVQNCSQLDRKFITDTILTIMNLLLKTENLICLGGILWNAGGKIKFSHLIKLLDPAILKCMKKQHGGMQTFLRNHRNVFKIKDGDVQLNVPQKGIPFNTKLTPLRKGARYEIPFQEKPCVFFFHHPNGCPLKDTDCNFNHYFKGFI